MKNRFRVQQTFLLDMFIMKARHCLWISRPGFWRFFRNSTKSLDTWSVSKLAWRLMDGLGDLPSWDSVTEEPQLEKKEKLYFLDQSYCAVFADTCGCTKDERVSLQPMSHSSTLQFCFKPNYDLFFMGLTNVASTEMDLLS